MSQGFRFFFCSFIREGVPARGVKRQRPRATPWLFSFSLNCHVSVFSFASYCGSQSGGSSPPLKPLSAEVHRFFPETQWDLLCEPRVLLFPSRKRVSLCSKTRQRLQVSLSFFGIISLFVFAFVSYCGYQSGGWDAQSKRSSAEGRQRRAGPCKGRKATIFFLRFYVRFFFSGVSVWRMGTVYIMWTTPKAAE